MVQQAEVKKELLRYLGSDEVVHIASQTGENFIDSLLDELVESVVDEIFKIVRPFHLLKIFSIQVKPSKNEIIFKHSTLSIISDDLAGILSEASQAGILVATLGYLVDQKIKYYSKSDLTRSVILDAAASAYIDLYCDEIQKEYEVPYIRDGYAFTFRFSPGYGDLSLEIQPQILSVMEATKKIGVSASDFFTLHPRKTITGIFGIVLKSSLQSSNLKAQRKADHPKCKTCRNYSHCIYLKEGKYCEYRKRNL